jgi:kynurenine formamidase
MIADLLKFTFVDLTHILSNTIPHWGSDCGFQHEIKLDYADCTSDVKFRVHKIEMYAGVGTHMDAPLHCFAAGASIADIPLDQLIAPCVVLDVSHQANGAIPKNAFVIVYTGWDQYWHQPEKYRNDLAFPSISKEAALLLVERDIVGIGIDTLSPDRPDSHFIVHQIMLSAGKYIVENVANAKSLPPLGSYAFVLPMKVHGGTEAPVRLIGMKVMKPADTNSAF